MFLRGRPVIMPAPSDVRDTFDIMKVQPAPSKKLKLGWVYGYRGKDCRSNLYQLPTGEMAYFVAAVVVLYNVDEQSQRHYIGHTDDIKSLAIHPNKLLVATGQCAGADRKDAQVRSIRKALVRCLKLSNLLAAHSCVELRVAGHPGCDRQRRFRRIGELFVVQSG